MSGDTTAAAVGSTADMVARMKAALPFAWFPVSTVTGIGGETPVLDSVLTGIGAAWSFCFEMFGYVRSQARLATVNGCFLDLFAVDFFGNTLRRRASETDDAFRSRLSASLLIPRATRAALSSTLLRLTGVTPRIVEPRRGADTGAFGVSGLGYGSGMPFQYLVSLDADDGVIRRESEASFLDIVGQLRIAPRHAARPVYADGRWQSFLVEPAGFNLLKDSVGFSGWSMSHAAGVANWAVNDFPGTALWSGHPTLEIAIGAAGSFPGPATSVFIGDQSACASIWVWLPMGHRLTELHLQFGDASGNAVVEADLTLVNQWQRLVVSIAGVSGHARTAALWLIGTSSGASANKIITQCWQVEPGTTATSFIPSAGQIGVRDQDRVSGDITVDDPAILLRDDIAEAIGRTVPAGSIAWLNIQLRQ